MKHFPPSARRLLGIAFATVAGAAMLTFAAPANAATVVDPVTVTHSDRCLPTGQHEVTWTVTNNTENPGNLTAVDLTSDPAGSGFVDGTIIKVGATLPAHPGQLVDKQLLPGDATGASLSVTVDIAADESSTKASGALEFGPHCNQAYTVSQDCHGITFTFKAPPPGDVVISTLVTLHPSVGADQSFTIKSGDSDKTVTFPGSPGLKVDLSYGDSFKTTYTWTHDPCPTLPTTGSSLTTTIGIGSGLVVVGVGLIALYLVLRRRRTVSGA